MKGGESSEEGSREIRIAESSRIRFLRIMGGCRLLECVFKKQIIFVKRKLTNHYRKILEMNEGDAQCWELDKGDGNQAEEMIWSKHATSGNDLGEIERIRG